MKLEIEFSRRDTPAPAGPKSTSRSDPLFWLIGERSGLSDPEKVANLHAAAVAAAIDLREMRRKAVWTEGIAVGSELFVRTIAGHTKRRKRLYLGRGSHDAWFIFEPIASYGWKREIQKSEVLPENTQRPSALKKNRRVKLVAIVDFCSPNLPNRFGGKQISRPGTGTCACKRRDSQVQSPHGKPQPRPVSAGRSRP